MDLALNVTYQSLMTLLTAAPRLQGVDPVYQDRLQAYVDDAIDRRHPHRRVHHRREGQPVAAAGQAGTTPTRTSASSTAAPTASSSAAPSCTSARASLCHDLLVMPTKSMKAGEEDYAITCAVPVNSPGVSVINTTYHPKGDDVRHYPVSSRTSMPDGFVVFDDVFVPDERVFLDGETSNAGVFAHSLGLWERLGGIDVHGASGRRAGRPGPADRRGQRSGRRVAHPREDRRDGDPRHAAAGRAGGGPGRTPRRTPEGFYYPDELFTNAAKYQGAAQFGRMVRHLHDIAGGAVLTAPSIADLENPATRGYVEKYMATGTRRQRRGPRCACSTPFATSPPTRTAAGTS